MCISSPFKRLKKEWVSRGDAWWGKTGPLPTPVLNKNKYPDIYENRLMILPIYGLILTINHLIGYRRMDDGRKKELLIRRFCKSDLTRDGL